MNKEFFCAYKNGLLKFSKVSFQHHTSRYSIENGMTQYNAIIEALRSANIYTNTNELKKLISNYVYRDVTVNDLEIIKGRNVRYQPYYGWNLRRIIAEDMETGLLYPGDDLILQVIAKIYNIGFIIFNELDCSILRIIPTNQNGYLLLSSNIERDYYNTIFLSHPFSFLEVAHLHLQKDHLILQELNNIFIYQNTRYISYQ